MHTHRCVNKPNPIGLGGRRGESAEIWRKDQNACRLERAYEEGSINLVRRFERFPFVGINFVSGLLYILCNSLSEAAAPPS